MSKLGDELSDIEYLVLKHVPENKLATTKEVAEFSGVPIGRARRVLDRLEGYGEVISARSANALVWERT